MTTRPRLPASPGARPKGRPRTRPLLVLLLLLTLLGAFALLAAAVAGGRTHAWDESLLLSLRVPGDPGDPLGGGNAEEAMRDLTALGGATWLVFLSAATAGALALLGQARSAVVLVVAVAGGQVLSHLAKGLFDRPRPDLVSHEAYVYTASFPSGHSMMAAVTYLTLAVMLARAAPSRALKAYVVGVALLLAVGVGVSRVYLGVHWPSDVLAGWLVGAAWALAFYLVADWLGRSGEIEPERDEGLVRPPSGSLQNHDP